jgi:hypothetical protein
LADYPSIAPSQSMEISLDAVLRVRDGELGWLGSDGLSGTWPLESASGPYSLRLHYRQTAATAVRPADGTSPLHGLWVGDATTNAIEIRLGRPD